MGWGVNGWVALQTENVGLEHFTQSFQDSLDLTDTADKIQVPTKAPRGT